MNDNMTYNLTYNLTYYVRHASPLGSLLLAATERGLCGIYFEQHKHFNGIKNIEGIEGWQQSAQHPILQQAACQLDEYFARQRTAFDIPLNLQGTPFQLLVWNALMRIPFGKTISYAEHASRIGRPGAARATGAAIGRNPVSIIVPCHRVLGSTGAVTGYAGGIERKHSLLALEGQGQN